jgi:hypothetical protein
MSHADPAGRRRRISAGHARRRHRTWRLTMSVAASRAPGRAGHDRPVTQEPRRPCVGRELIFVWVQQRGFVCGADRHISCRRVTASRRLSNQGAIRRYHEAFRNALTGINDSSAFATHLADTTPMAARPSRNLRRDRSPSRKWGLRITDPRNFDRPEFVNVRGRRSPRRNPAQAVAVQAPVVRMRMTRTESHVEPFQSELITLAESRDRARRRPDPEESCIARTP